MGMEVCVMAVLAHPDDELAIAGTLAGCAAEGVRVVLVCATSGELGAIADPSLASRETLGPVRRQELRCSCRSLGIRDLEFLPYRDSGWRPDHGEPPSGSLARAQPAEVIAILACLLRRYRPQVVLTFGPDGLYGHRDHVAIGAYATAAFGAAGDPAYRCGQASLEPWCAQRLFFISLPPELRRLAGHADVAPIGQITHQVNVEAHVQAKLNAARCHQTQRQMWERLEALQADEASRPLFAIECLTLAQERTLDGEVAAGDGPISHLLCVG